MAKVHVCNVLVLDNPASFMSKLEFEITFECIEDLPEDLVRLLLQASQQNMSVFDLLPVVFYQNVIVFLDQVVSNN